MTGDPVVPEQESWFETFAQQFHPHVGEENCSGENWGSLYEAWLIWSAHCHGPQGPRSGSRQGWADCSREMGESEP